MRKINIYSYDVIKEGGTMKVKELLLMKEEDNIQEEMQDIEDYLANDEANMTMVEIIKSWLEFNYMEDPDDELDKLDGMLSYLSSQEKINSIDDESWISAEIATKEGIMTIEIEDKILELEFDKEYNLTGLMFYVPTR